MRVCIHVSVCAYTCVSVYVCVCVCVCVCMRYMYHMHTIAYMYCIALSMYIFSVFLLQCSSENSTQLRISSKQTYTYRVKVVNCAKKSEYSIKRVRYTEKFSSVEDIRAELQSLDVATKDNWLH